MIFNCTVILKPYPETINPVVVTALWKRDGVIIKDSTPRHTLLQTQHEYGLAVTGLMVDNTTLNDNGATYSCTMRSAPSDFVSSVVLNVVGGI